MFVFKAAVVGAGTMGGEIAHVIADADVPVVLKDVDRARVDAGVQRARSRWQARVDAGKLDPAEAERRLALIIPATDYAPFADVDFAIEAVPEEIAIKQIVMSELDEATPGHAILASNTSSLSITEMGEVTSRPDKVVGFHFFYPASVSRLIEIVEGEDTAPETAQAASNFAQAIRKMGIRCIEAPGFVVNRILNAAVSELWRGQEQGAMTVQDLDAGVVAITGGPAGPFATADVLGLDTCVHVAEHLRDSYGERFYVHGGMRELVAAGHLGVKTGRGFYEHRV
jgi:3-hydroxyacyl-CoA dehydrogenase